MAYGSPYYRRYFPDSVSRRCVRLCADSSSWVLDAHNYCVYSGSQLSCPSASFDMAKDFSIGYKTNYNANSIKKSCVKLWLCRYAGESLLQMKLMRDYTLPGRCYATLRLWQPAFLKTTLKASMLQGPRNISYDILLTRRRRIFTGLSSHHHVECLQLVSLCALCMKGTLDCPASCLQLARRRQQPSWHSISNFIRALVIAIIITSASARTVVVH